VKAYHAIASARPVAQAQECFSAWRDMGYGVASIRDRHDLDLDFLLILPEWHGLWQATNTLSAHVLEQDPECQVIVAAGDDVWPDQTKRADEIADEFVEHFHGTLGVMQPVGVVLKGHSRICWSPWLGREWCRRAFCGVGPTEPRFFHYFGDAYLQLVAERLGLLWEWRGLSHDHKMNWKKLQIERPPHLYKAKDMWLTDRNLFNWLIAAGFPDAELAE
jgi:hypothetical protein